eukprot:TRINITY_DN25621_c0_g1_i1.p1 TRINITY_DN25621_c0_g1~~TRINITY_DN25621_c0_g1_i1.p1  ORF type:complete len:1109 (+),score=291.87 TRINITY_DN25621_c0_g1_i1:122-3448(+)
MSRPAQPQTPFRKTSARLSGQEARFGGEPPVRPKRPTAAPLPDGALSGGPRASVGSLGQMVSAAGYPSASGCHGELEETVDPWACIADPARMMVCDAGHPLQEISLMCAVCHGKESCPAAAAANAVFFCHACRLIVCYACKEVLEGDCMQRHADKVSFLQLRCDQCGYLSAFHPDKRRDPATGRCVTRDAFPSTPTTRWEDAAVAWFPRSRRFYGCVACNYDICEKCASRRTARGGVSGSVVVRGRRVHILSFRAEPAQTQHAAVMKLIAQARVVIPAVLNFLHLRRTTKRACLYFGRYDQYGNTVGIADVVTGTTGGKKARTALTTADELRRDFLRIMMKELWPPLNVDSVSDRALSPSAMRFVLSSNMQALLWVKHVPLPCGGSPKPGAGRVYVKLILQNVPHLYYDNASPGQEKHRWTNRQLHVRRLDNLETERAVWSFEAYSAALRNACAWARAHYDTRAPPPAPVAVAAAPEGECDFKYGFGERLFADEDSLLDYKSYWVDPMAELLHHVPKFMAGFANAYGRGSLLVGVMEIPRYELTAQKPGDADTTVPDIWRVASGLEDKAALVMGVTLTKRELAALSRGLTQAFQKCIPPLPPAWVKVVPHAVRRPEPYVGAAGGCVGVAFHVEGNFRNARVIDTFRALAHRALRILLGHGLALVQLAGGKASGGPALPAGHAVLRYVVVRGDAQQAAARCHAQQATAFHPLRAPHTDARLPRPAWRIDLDTQMKQVQECVIFDMESAPPIPPLCVLEVSVDRDDALLTRPKDLAVAATKPLMFTGWPSIPIWDEVNDEVRQVPKDLKLFERRRVRGTSKHWLEDFAILQRVLACLRPGNGSLCLAAAEARGWAALMRLREVSKGFYATVMVVSGLNAFEWPAEDHVERLAVPHATLRQCRRMPPVWRLLLSTAGDIAMPFPYAAVPPSVRTAPFSLGRVRAAPFLRRVGRNGVDERLAVVICIATARLLLLCEGAAGAVAELVPVTGVSVVPMTTTGFPGGDDDDAPPAAVGGFELTHTPGLPPWDVPAFMLWYQTVAQDACVALTPAASCMALRLTGLADAGGAVPSLCVRHHPGGDGAELVEDREGCEWCALERKWARTQGKCWRD